MDQKDPREAVSDTELAEYRWVKHGARAQAPGVLMDTLKR